MAYGSFSGLVAACVMCVDINGCGRPATFHNELELIAKLDRKSVELTQNPRFIHTSKVRQFMANDQQTVRLSLSVSPELNALLEQLAVAGSVSVSGTRVRHAA